MHDNEESEWVVLNSCALRKVDLTIESGVNGYYVTGIPQRIRDQITNDERRNEVARGERLMSTTVLKKHGSGSGGYNMAEIVNQQF